MPAKKTGTTEKAASKNKETAETVTGAKGRPSLVGSMRSTVLRYGDLISPIDVEWDANK